MFVETATRNVTNESGGRGGPCWLTNFLLDSSPHQSPPSDPASQIDIRIYAWSRRGTSNDDTHFIRLVIVGSNLD